VRIDSSSLLVAASHSLGSRREVRETVLVRSPASLAAGRAPASAPGPGKPALDTGSDYEDLRTAVARWLLEWATGVKAPARDARGLAARMQQVARQVSASLTAAAQARPGWSVAFTRSQVYQETERSVFSAEGTVNTADGRSIQFQLTLALDREFTSVRQAGVRLGDAAATDPLVLNFDGTGARLTGNRISFDLNGEGAAECVPALAPGSAYLALDRNGDGKITDGTELFGPRTGDGFGELASLDGDGDGWIDQDDAAYQRLRLWSLEDGTPSSLAEAGVGAIAVNPIATPFAEKGAGNEWLGQVRASSVYLREDGRAGVVQQVDLAPDAKD
jgi:hypothetical protein